MKHEITFIEMERSLVKGVTELHLESFAAHEISAKLGMPFLTIFYDQVAKSDTAFTYCAVSGERLLGFATGFVYYDDFNCQLQRAVGIKKIYWALRGMISGSIQLSELIDAMRYKKVTKCLSDTRCHLGALALAPELKGTKTGKLVFKTLMKLVFTKIIESKSSLYCFGVCDSRNHVMLKVLEKMGFYVAGEVKGMSKKFVVTEILLSSATLKTFIEFDSEKLL